jgi:SNF2 family DNA or RNA helicase
LIFSSFVQHLTLLADRFDERGWRYAWLTGSTVNREEVIDRFNNDESVGAFFISLKAGGTGLNLTAADYVFIMDPWWNPAAEMQAVSRAHRIGQEKKVTLYRFITKGTVEEKIQQLQRYKKELTDTVIRHRFSLEEMEALLE